MKEFLLVFRNDKQYFDPSPGQMQERAKLWQDWIENIANRDNRFETGKRLNADGKVVTSDNVVSDGPYVETKELINGYMFLYAADIYEATELAKGCPILVDGGSVEVRPIIAANKSG